MVYSYSCDGNGLSTGAITILNVDVIHGKVAAADLQRTTFVQAPSISRRDGVGNGDGVPGVR